MKKVIALMSVIGLLAFTNLNSVMAQDAAATDPAAQTEVTDDSAAVAEEAVAAEPVAAVADEVEESKSFHEVLKEKYIQGGAGWMTPVLLCLILGMALVIERIIYLNMATTNVDALLGGIEDNVKKGDYNAAKELCRNTRGPVASIFYQGLDRIDEGLENVEKSLTSYGGVQMARLEANLTWIALFIALAPSFGFLGTVIGMVQAFDDIEKAGDISPTVVAGGMKVALLTTIFGLIVAIILQIFYNYILTKIESLVAQMEDGTITFMDILVKNKK
ncbi:MAG: MotA/TolQ/ExbB proton channel family protein [Bacteroidales bacterium]|jgi:biopolymer transport protein ExbB|nr:MotA/TolQ/ExbB proton channel family protein [Bacteroidales bacterium]